MIELDHIAITVDNLENSIEFYELIGYNMQNKFEDEDYRWATLKLGKTSLEIFEKLKKELPKIEHFAYSFTNDEEVFEIATKLGYKADELNIFYGDLNRKSFFIEDNNGLSIQMIKKKTRIKDRVNKHV